MRRRHCSYCQMTGHTRRTCPVLHRRAKEWPHSAEAAYVERMEKKKKQKRCGFCRRLGHTRRTCESRRTSMNEIGKLDEQWKKQALHKMREMGIGPGALLKSASTDDSGLLMVVDINWINIHMGMYETVKLDKVLRESKHFMKYDRSYINYTKPLSVFYPNRGIRGNTRIPRTAEHWQERFFDSESHFVVVSPAEVPDPPEWWYKNHQWIKKIL